MEKTMSRNFGVIVVPPLPEERYIDSTYNTIEEAVAKLKFLEAHLIGARIEISDWSNLNNEGRKEPKNLAQTINKP